MKSTFNYYWPEEDDKLLSKLVEEKGVDDWTNISMEIYFHFSRFISPSKCRERWKNHLCSDLQKGKWSEEEDELLMKLTEANGSKWSKIAKLMGSQKTEEMVKNRYKFILKGKKKEDAGCKYLHSETLQMKGKK